MTTWKKPSGGGRVPACKLVEKIREFFMALTSDSFYVECSCSPRHLRTSPIGSILVSTTQGRSEKEGALDYIHETIQSHPFNHQLQILIPLPTGNLSSSLQKTLTDLGHASSSCVARVSLLLFLDPLFVTSYLKRGNLVALSIGKIDTEDVACVDGQGTLHLSLCRDTYQTLGLEGQKLHRSRGSSGRAADRQSGEAERYVVRINLTASHFTAGKPGYERVRTRIKAWEASRAVGDHVWTMLFSWSHEHDAQLGSRPQFPARHVHTDTIHDVPIGVSIDEIEDVWIPSTTHANLLENWGDASWRESLEALWEWVFLSCSSSESIRTYWRPNHLTLYQTPEPRQQGRVARIKYTGFLTPMFCSALVSALSKTSVEENRFCSVQCSGFADAPLAWISKASTKHKRNLSGTHHPRDMGADAKLQAKSTEIPTSQFQANPEQGLRTNQEHASPTQPYFSSDDDSDVSHSATGLSARRKRNKARHKRGYTDPELLGYNVANPGSPSLTSAWQVILTGRTDSSFQSLLVENLGATARS